MSKYTVSSGVTDNWDGKTGQQVQDNIRNEFESVSEHIGNVDDKLIKSIEFSEPDANSGKITVTLTKNDNSTISGEFETIAQSQYDTVFEIINGNNQVVNLDTNPTIQYKYAVTDELKDYVSGMKGTIAIKNKKTGVELSLENNETGLSRNGEYTYNFEIPRSIFGNQCGKIDLDIECKTNTSGNQWTKTQSKPLTIYRVGLDLKLNPDDDDDNQIFKLQSDTDNSVQIKYRKRYSDGSAISVTDDIFKVVPHIYTGGTQSGNEKSRTEYYEHNEGEGIIDFNIGKIMNVNDAYTELFMCLTAERNGNIIARSNYVSIYIGNSNNTSNAIKITGFMYPSSISQSGGTLTFEKEQYQNLTFGTDYNTSDIILKLYNTSSEKYNIKINALDTPYTFDIEGNGEQYINYSLLCRNSNEKTALNSDSRMFTISTKANSQDNYGPADIEMRLNVNDFPSNFKQIQDQALKISYNCDNANVDSRSNDIWGTGDTKAVFEGFDFATSKWTEENGERCLKISGDARVRIPYNIFSDENLNSSTGDTGYAVSFRYKIVSGERSNNPVIYSQNDNGDGFFVYPRWVRLRNGGSDMYIDNNDQEVHEVTFVCYFNSNKNGIWKGTQAIYIDGQIQLISGASKPAGDQTRNIIIGNPDSNCTIYVYNVNIINRSISFLEAQSLYCFNSLKGQDLANYITSNTKILNTDQVGVRNLDVNAQPYLYSYVRTITPETLPDGAIYMIISSKLENDEVDGIKLSYDPDPWFEINKSGGNSENIEVEKKIRHAVGGIGLYQKNSKNTKRNFFALEGTLSPQGTSSMDYPIKNLRIYFNKATSIEYVQNQDKNLGKTKAIYQNIPEPSIEEKYIPSYDEENKLSKNEYCLFNSEYGSGIDSAYTIPSASANRFCLKADYAESSGSHNTGFARLANEVLKTSDKVTDDVINASERNEFYGTPPQYMAGNEFTYENKPEYNLDVRTNIDGRAIYLFYYRPKCRNKDGIILEEQVYYAGRYNLNNDKANEHVFGFKGVSPYESNDIVKEEYKELLKKEGAQEAYDAENETHINAEENYKENHNWEGGEWVNPTECWEFSTNSGSAGLIGAFLNPNINDVFNKPGNVIDPETKKKIVANWMGAWEYRFPDIEDNVKESKYPDTKYQEGTTKPYLLKTIYKFLIDNSYCLQGSNKISVLNTFAGELKYYFNVDNLIKYYVLTHWFGCIDQRVKNAMIAFYCDPGNVSSAEAEASPMHYMRAYFIFYDNDTILGLKNDGTLPDMLNSNGSANVKGIPWDLDEKTPGTFALNDVNGNSATIWDNLYQCHEIYLSGKSTGSNAYRLGYMISQAYANLRQKITYNIFNDYFNTYHVKYYPDSVQNIDTEIKYLFPKSLQQGDSYQAEPQHLSKDQGTRYLYRDLWFKSRTRLLDNINQAGDNAKYKIVLKGITPPGGVTFGKLSWTIDPKFANIKWKVSMSNQDGSTVGRVISNGTDPYLSYGRYDNNSTLQICGLYALDSIKMVEDAGETKEFSVLRFDDSVVYENLKKIEIAGRGDTSVTEINIVSNILPNLEDFVFNITTESKTFNFDLRGFSKLKTIDLTSTKIDQLHLPFSIENITADNIQSLYIDGCSKIQEGNINVSYTNELVVKNSNKTVYDYVIDMVTNKSDAGSSIGTVTIQFDKVNNELYQPDEETFIKIYNLAYKAHSNNPSFGNLTLRGTILYTDPDEDTSVMIDTLRSWYGEDFIQEVEDSSEAYIMCKSGEAILKEDEYSYSGTNGISGDSVVSVTEGQHINSDGLNDEAKDLITFNAVGFKVNSWKVEAVGSSNTISIDSIYFAYASRTGCKLYLKPTAENTQASGTFKIIANYNSGSIEKEFTCRRIPITSFTTKEVGALSETKTLFQKSGSQIIIKPNGNHTKKSLLNSNWQNVFTIENTPSSYLYNAVYDSSQDGIILSFSNAISNTVDEILFTIKIKNNNYSSDFSLLRDFQLTDVDSSNPDPKYDWIISLLWGNNNLPSQQRYPFRSDCYKFAGAQSLMSTLSFNSQENNEPRIQDLTYLKYFNFDNQSLTLSSGITFNKLVTPENCTQVKISSLPATDTIYIKLRKSVKSGEIVGAYTRGENNLPNDIHIDLSENDSIRTIGGISNKNEIGYLTFKLSYTIPDSNISDINPKSNGIFNLNKNIAYSIGDENKIVYSSNANYPVFLNTDSNMISLTVNNEAINFDTGPTFSALYRIIRNDPEADAGLEVSLNGNIYGYKVDPSRAKGFLSNNQENFIIKTKGAFARGSGLPINSGKATFSNLTDIGNCTFEMSGDSKLNSIQLTQSTDINVVLQNLEDQATIQLDNNNITNIGDHAFYNCVSPIVGLEYNDGYDDNHKPSTDYQLQKLTSIGNGAFEEMFNDMVIYIKVGEGQRLNIGQRAFCNTRYRAGNYDGDHIIKWKIFIDAKENSIINVSSGTFLVGNGNQTTVYTNSQAIIDVVTADKATSSTGGTVNVVTTSF